MYFWYVMFKFDRAHPHLLPPKRFRTLMRLETQETMLSTWFFQFNLLSKVTPRYLNSFVWERAVPLYLNLGLFCELGRMTEKLFLMCLSSYYFSHTIWPVPCLVFVLCFLLLFFYLSRSRRQGHLHAVSI